MMGFPRSVNCQADSFICVGHICTFLDNDRTYAYDFSVSLRPRKFKPNFSWALTKFKLFFCYFNNLINQSVWKNLKIKATGWPAELFTYGGWELIRSMHRFLAEHGRMKICPTIGAKVCSAKSTKKAIP